MSFARLDVLRSSSVDAGGELKLFTTVTDQGQRRGTEIVQRYAAECGYWHDASGAADHRLRRRRPRAGGSQDRQLRGADRLLACTGLSGALVMEPGPVEVSAGSNSSAIRSARKSPPRPTPGVDDGITRFFPTATVG